MLPVAIRRDGHWLEPYRLDGEFGRMLRQMLGEDGPGKEMTGAYPVDIDEDDEAVTVEAELPGFKREEVNVTVDNGMLSIIAERQPEEKKGTVHLSERRLMRVERRFTLPASVDEDKAEAKLEGGVLKLRLPKTAESKPKQIKLK